MVGVALAARAVLPNGFVVGLESPLVLAAIPLVAVVLWLLVYRDRTGTAAPASRRAFLASRLLLVVLVVVAAAGPYTVVTRETAGDPQVSLLVDRSDSMAVNEDVAADLAAAIEDAGVPATVSTIADGTDSRIGDGIAANVREGGSVVVVSDGQVTGGQSLATTAEFARSVNATVSAVTLRPARTERYVTLSGPAKASAGVESRFLAEVDGVRLGGPVTVTVDVDGEPVATATLDGDDRRLPVTHTFEEPGTHRVTASVSGGDVYDDNDVVRRTVRVVERPRVLYVSRAEFPLASYLETLYDVDRADRVPEDLEPYYAVVVQDLAAADVGDVDELQRFVIDGNGLVVVGGRNSYENGGYAGSPVASILPVTFGDPTPGSARLVLLVDVSGSASEGMRVQKATALSVLSQLGDENTVGAVGFNYEAYAVAQPEPLGTNRALLEDRIRRLEAGGSTSIANGLRGAEEMLGDGRGTVILISDGWDTPSGAPVVANALGRSGVRVIAVGAGPQVNEPLMQRIAAESGGQYLRATETDRLRLLFGGASRQFQGEGLTVVDTGHFITSGVELTADPGQVNDVSLRPGADFLVAAGDGTPALASWRYGLGRVVSVTTYGPDGGLDGLLSRPDSLVVTKSVNYAIGDPERKETGVTSVGDTRVGEPTTVVYRGSSPPATTGLSFRAVAPGVYQAEVTPDAVGFQEAAGATYAANAPAEHAAFGTDPRLGEAVRLTGGRQFEPTEGAAIAAFATQQSVRVRDVRRGWDWLLLLLALSLYLAEVVLRRLQVYQGRTRHESGLP